MKIVKLSDLKLLRETRNLKEVEIMMDDFLHGNLPLYVLKFALWACELNGYVILNARKTVNSVTLVAGQHSFQLLLQLLCKAADGLGVMVECDIEDKRVKFKRKLIELEITPWSAAVIFSGSDTEINQLRDCIRGLQAQPELRNGGQIVVCGPASGKTAISTIPGIEYLIFETQFQAGRFIVGKKKNFAIQALRHERILICHTRIVLQPGCLAKIPLEFDLCTPRVWIKGQYTQLPYLDLGFLKRCTLNVDSHFLPLPIHYDRQNWIQHLKTKSPYIDGGIFCVQRSIALKIPMSESVAWGEAEDVEWCARLLQNGITIELAIDSHADSTICKIPRYGKRGGSWYYRALSNILHFFRNFLNIVFKRI